MPSFLKFFFISLTISSVVFLSACGSANRPPSEPPVYVDNAPPITEGAYAVYETQRIFDAPLEPLRRYIEDGFKIVAAMEETENIKKPVETVILSGTWPETGSVRSVKLSDGHYTMERVIENNFPTLFRYQVWDFTAAAGNNLDYAVGQQAWEVLPDGRSQLTWTYSLRPNAGFKRPFVQRFVDNDMRPLMENALNTVKAQAEAHFANHIRRNKSLDTVNRFFTALENEDKETALSLLSENAMLHAPYNPNGDTSDRAIRSFPASLYVAGALQTYDNLVFEDRDYSIGDNGNTIWVEAEGRLRVAETGRPYENRYVFKIKLKDETVESITEYTNVATLARDGVVAREDKQR